MSFSDSRIAFMEVLVLVKENETEIKIARLQGSALRHTPLKFDKKTSRLVSSCRQQRAESK